MTTSYLQPSLFDPAAGPRTWPWGSLEPCAYDLIMADPPWRFELYSEAGEEKSPQAHYGCLSLDEIAAMPVADLAARNCLLWLWATAPMLDVQMDILKRWGFRFVTSGTWVKMTVNGKVNFGTGYVLRNAHEPFLIGAIGAPRTTRSVRSVVMGALREHSRKPDAAYAAAEQLVPDGPAGSGRKVRRASLFERVPRQGWDGWGDEYGLPLKKREKVCDETGVPRQPSLL